MHSALPKYNPYPARLRITIMKRIFMTGATGYMGKSLVPLLLARGHEVLALVRKPSVGKLPSGCVAVTGDALDKNTYQSRLAGADTFIQLAGVSHPSPAKAAEFRKVDLVASYNAIDAAQAAGVAHFIYVSVAHPAPMMKAYIEVRRECEEKLRASGLNATILRPWYVLGPGHRWPYLLLPAYWLLEALPSTSNSARRLGLVTLPQMVAALLHAVEHPAEGSRIVDVPAIRASANSTPAVR
jgi:uncharacterized protein YbjT (DUF2867 family)